MTEPKKSQKTNENQHVNWLPIFAIAAGTFSTVTTEFLPVGLLPQIAASFGVSIGSAGWMVTIPGLVAACAAPLLLVKAGRIDRRTILLALTVTTAISNLVSAMAANFTVMLVGRILLGICVGGFWAVAANLGRRLVPEDKKDRATAIIMAGISAGTVCGLPAGAWVGLALGWRVSFVINCILAVLILLAQTLTLPKCPAQSSFYWSNLARPLRLSAVRLGLLATFFVIAGYFAGYAFLSPYLMQMFAVSGQVLSSLFLVYGIAGIGGTFMAERLLGLGVRKALVFVSIGLVFSMLIGHHLGHGLLAAIVFVVLIGAGFGAAPVCLSATLFEATPTEPEAGQALLTLVFQAAIALGTAIGGTVVSRIGVSQVMLSGGGIILIAVILVVVGTPQPRSGSAALERG